MDRKFFTDLSKEHFLNASHFKWLGQVRHSEIVVDNVLLDRLVKFQSRLERLHVMGDDEYRGFYIEVPRPTPEEWGDSDDLIASEEYRRIPSGLAIIQSDGNALAACRIHQVYGTEDNSVY